MQQLPPVAAVAPGVVRGGCPVDHRGCCAGVICQLGKSSALTAAGAFGGREQDEDRQVLAYVEEAVVDPPLDEQQRAGGDRHVLVAAPEPCPAADYVVDLVLGVRGLSVGFARLETIDAQAQRGDAKELPPLLMIHVAHEGGEVKGVHP